MITAHLADAFGSVVGLDTDPEALAMAVTRFNRENVLYIKGDATRLPFDSKRFDVVVCNHIYEHVPSAEELMQEIERVLKRDGVCYFSAGNRYWLLEPHYRLPFLGWLPRNIADRYLQITGKGEHYYERLLPLWHLRTLVKDFEIHDYTLEITRDPEKYHAQDVFAHLPFVSRIPQRLLEPLLYLVPSYIWMLKKRSRIDQTPATNEARPS
jgi:ubiquinone/menaquinone biosynthesis C-methylase UbiE